MTPAAPAEEYQPDPRRWRALWITLTAGFMGLLDVSIVAVALPSMERSLGGSTAGVQWVVSGYALTFGLVLVAAGRLGDAWGRRRMFLLSMSGFVLTSALCGAAPSLAWLVVGRLVQGLAAGMVGPQNSGLIQDLFRGPERAKAFGMFGASVGLSTAVGPVLGGVLLGLFSGPDGWRWIFFVNVPIGLVVLALAPRFLPGRPESEPSLTRAGRLDLVGTALLGVGVLVVMLPLLEPDRIGELWWLLLVAIALFAAFVWWEARVARLGVHAPLLDLTLLTETPGYASGAALGMAYFVGFSGIWMVLALFFQSGLGLSPLYSGLAVTPFAVGSSVSALAGGGLVARWGRLLTVWGLGGVAIGLIGAAFTLADGGADAALWAAVPLLVAGIGGGLVITPNITLTLDAVPVRMAGAAGGALQTGQRIGAAVGTALLAGVYYSVLGASDHRPGPAVFDAMLCAVLFVLVAAGIGGYELWRAGPRGRGTTRRVEHEVYTE